MQSEDGCLHESGYQNKWLNLIKIEIVHLQLVRNTSIQESKEIIETLSMRFDY